MDKESSEPSGPDSAEHSDTFSGDISEASSMSEPQKTGRPDDFCSDEKDQSKDSGKDESKHDRVIETEEKPEDNSMGCGTSDQIPIPTPITPGNSKTEKLHSVEDGQYGVSLFRDELAALREAVAALRAGFVKGGETEKEAEESEACAEEDDKKAAGGEKENKADEDGEVKDTDSDGSGEGEEKKQEEKKEKKDEEIEEEDENKEKEDDKPPREKAISDLDNSLLLWNPSEISDNSPSRLEWLRQKQEEGIENTGLDGIMCMIGMENVKATFLSVKEKICLLKRRGDYPQARQMMTIETDWVTGNDGSGKHTVRRLFHHMTNELMASVPENEKEIGDDPTLNDAIIFRPTKHKPVKMHIEDINDDGLLELCKRILRLWKIEVEGGFDGEPIKRFIKRIGKKRNSGKFRNFRDLYSGLQVAWERAEVRIQKERADWERGGKVGDAPNDLFMNGVDLVGQVEDYEETSEAYKKLMKMVGLEKVKEEAKRIVGLVRMNRGRELEGKEPMDIHLNRIIIGPPGTGKTTAAKLLAEIIEDVGYVSEKPFTLLDAKEWADGYPIVSIDEASGRVLILDDFHKLLTSDMYNAGDASYVDKTIFKAIDALINGSPTEPNLYRGFILVGRSESLRETLSKVNPTLQSRFPLEDALEIESFTKEQLEEILDNRIKELKLSTTPNAREVAIQTLERVKDRPGFKYARNIIDLVDRAQNTYRTRVSRLVLQGHEAPSEIVLEPEDFDKDWMKNSAAGPSCVDLFEEFVGFEKVTQRFEGYRSIVAGMRLHGKDPTTSIPFTFVFKGPPGSGKTSTARKIGQIFYDMGFLTSNKVYDCSATDLVAEYIGHTGPKVRAAMDKALGKVLFIDEAYRLACSPGDSDSFREEAIVEMVDCLTKPRYMGKLIVILAGYTEDMDRLLRSNRGLKSRFATEIVFPQLTPKQCLQFLGQQVGKMDITIRDREVPTAEEKAKVNRLFSKLSATSNWANGRDVETLGQTIIGEVYRMEGMRGTKSKRLQVSTRELIVFLQNMLRERLAGEKQEEYY